MKEMKKFRNNIIFFFSSNYLSFISDYKDYFEEEQASKKSDL